ncbi:hypothetical protein [Dyadobacter sp. 32]
MSNTKIALGENTMTMAAGAQIDRECGFVLKEDEAGFAFTFFVDKPI